MPASLGLSANEPFVFHGGACRSRFGLYRVAESELKP